MTTNTKHGTTGGYSEQLGTWDLENGDQLRAVYRETRNGNGSIWVLSREKGSLGWGSLEHAQGLVNKEAGKTIWGEPTKEETMAKTIEDLEFKLNVARNTLQGIVDGEFHNNREMARQTIKVIDEEA